MKRLKQKYETLARSIKKAKNAPVKKARVAEEALKQQSSGANARVKGKPRPMSSKPRRSSAHKDEEKPESEEQEQSI